MVAIVFYDASSRRDAKLVKICRKYLKHMQKSVFIGMITEGKLNQLKREIQNVIVCEQDAVCVIKLSVLKYVSIEQLGRSEPGKNNIL